MIQANDEPTDGASRMRALRAHLALTQQAMADRLGLSRTWLNGIERGRRTVPTRAARIESMARGLGVPAERLAAYVLGAVTLRALMRGVTR